jgi:hypothetical protein
MAIKTVTTPKDRAKMAGARNTRKAVDKADARDRDTKRNWSGRGTSGDEIANKEKDLTRSLFINDMITAMNAEDTDVANAERYGRDAYKSRGFGQGNKKEPENKGSLNYAAGGKLEMVKKDGKSVPAFAADGVGKMNMGGMNMGGMMGYKKGGKIDGIAMKGKTKGRMC